jgi:hypothetical protein
MVNPYFLEMYMVERQHEIQRAMNEAQVRSGLRRGPSTLRRAAGEAIVRFGLFLNGRSYHCPEALTQR